jgi:hypothetical protein
VNLVEQTNLLSGIEDQATVDIDSLLQPVYGHAKQGAGFGHTKISGKQVLRKGLTPLPTTISTRHSAAPVVAGIRLRGGRAGSGKVRPRWSARRSPPRGPPCHRCHLGARRLGLRQRRCRRCVYEGDDRIASTEDPDEPEAKARYRS